MAGLWRAALDRLAGTAFSLPAGCTITKVTGNNDGFWLQGTPRIVFDSMAAAQGRQVPAGTYNVYPNLVRGAAQASVQVSFTCL